MSKLRSLLLMSAAMAILSDNKIYENTVIDRQAEPKRKIIPSGCTEFYYGENSLFAINQKNADRKAKQKGWL